MNMSNNVRTLPRSLPKRELFLGGLVDSIGNLFGGNSNGFQAGNFQQNGFVNEGTQFPGGPTDTGGPIDGSTTGPLDKAKNALSDTASSVGNFIKDNPQILSTVVSLFQNSNSNAIQQQGNPNSIRRRPGANLPTGSTASTSGGSTTNVIAHGGYLQNKFAKGGSLRNMKQDAKKIQGPKHEQGGVQLDQNTEVEGGETIDEVNGSDYVFSDRLTVPKSVLPEGKRGMTFAEYHEHLVENNANQSQIQELAEIQERVAGRDQQGDSIQGRNQEQKQPNQRQKHMGPLGKRLQQMNQAYGGYAHGNNLATTGEDQKRNGGEVEYQGGGMLPDSVSDIPGLGNATGSTDDFLAGVTNDAIGGSDFLSQAGNFAEGALPYLPSLLNVGRALFEDSEVPDVPYSPPSGRAEETIQRMDTDINVDDQLASVDRSLRSITADPNASLAQKRAAASNAAQQRAQIEGQEERKEVGLRNQMLNRLSSAQQQRDRAISQGRTQAAQAERRQQMKADEAQMNLLQTGLQQASQRFQQQRRWEDKLDMDAMSLASQLATVPNEDVRNHVLNMLRERFPGKADRVEQIMINQ